MYGMKMLSASVIRHCSGWLASIGLTGLLLTGVLWLLPGPARAEQFVFFQDGRAIQADNVEVIGQRIRITRPSGEIVDIPKSAVRSIHDATPPSPTPSPPPAASRPDLTQQMNNEVRQQIQQQKSLAPPPRF